MQIELNNKADRFLTYKATYQGVTAFGSTRLIAIKNLLFKLLLLIVRNYYFLK